MKNQPSSILNKVCYHVAVKSHKRPGCGHVRMCEVILRPCKSLWGGASSSRTWQIDLKLSDFYVFLVWLKRFFVGERLCDGIPKKNQNIYFGLRVELCARFACKRLNPDNTLLLFIAQANTSKQNLPELCDYIVVSDLYVIRQKREPWRK